MKGGHPVEGSGQIPSCGFYDGYGELTAHSVFNDLRGLWYKVDGDSWNEDYFWRNAMDLSLLVLEQDISAGVWGDLK